MIIWICFQNYTVAGNPLYKLVGACANRCLATVIVLSRCTSASLCRDDFDGRHVVRHKRIGVFCFDMNRMAVDLLKGFSLEIGDKARR